MSFTCPYCGENAPSGASVCRGCGAEILYGQTREEKSATLWGGITVGLVLAFVFFRHVWWAYLLLGVVSPIVLWRISYFRGQVRFFRGFEYQ